MPRKRKDASRRTTEFNLEDFISPDYEATTEHPGEKIKRPGLFDYVNDLSYTKEGLAFKVQEETGSWPSEFVPFIVVKAFGNYWDTVLLANELNIRFQETPADAQYQFWLNAVPKKKRFAKFHSEDKDRTDLIRCVATYFQWGSKEAEANLKMLTQDELDYIRRNVHDERN